jgi:cysteine-rich repeat protein
MTRAALFAGILTVVCASRTHAVASGDDPVCGNGVVEVNEECDDGNERAHDGCDLDCQVEHIDCRQVIDRDDSCDSEDSDWCAKVCVIEPQSKTTVLPL